MWNPDAQVILDDAGQPYARVDGQLFRIDGASAELLTAVAAQAGDSNAERSIVEALAGRYPLNDVRLLLGVLADARILIEAESMAVSPAPKPIGGAGDDPRGDQRPQERLLLVGNGRLAHAVADAMRSRGVSVETLVAAEFPSCQTDTFLRFERDRTIRVDGARPRSVEREVFDRVLSSVSIERLRELFASVELVVCALEDVPYRALFDINTAAIDSRTPCLFVRASTTRGLIGPTVVSGLTACFQCAALREDPLPDGLRDALEHLRTPTIDNAAGSPVLSDVCGRCVDEALSVLGRSSALLAASVIEVRAGGHRAEHPLLPAGECPTCSLKSEAKPSGELSRAANIEAAVQIARLWPVAVETRSAPSRDGYRSVGILGGGTAGYLTALALRALRPELSVTLIESSSIPIIGVGEATTPELVKFLHSKRFLGRDIVDFFRRVRPSFKLGIKFQWGLPPPYEFTFPFQRGRLLESQLYESTINEQSLGAMLMMRNRVPLLSEIGGRQSSLLHLVRFAYHLDNERFVLYLRDEARRTGIDYVDTVISDAELTADGKSIAALVGRDGHRYAFDLYVDCSGFASFLLEKKLGSPFISYADSLFTDCAVTANVPHDGTVKPYTLAETMHSGWCWNIPFESDDHRGYVFASAFTNVDQAIDEMRSKNPGMSEPKVIKFRSGRHAHWWKGNVVGMGNSFAFVEPLESTALHMLVLQLEILTSHFPASRHDEALKAVLNAKVAKRWDALRWFLGIHYKFNRRLDTPFWRAARDSVDISGAVERVELFRERAPLSYRTSVFYTLLPPEFFSDDHSFDTLLMGQQVPAQWLQPIEDTATWRCHRTLLNAVAGEALPQHEALPLLRETCPDLLSEFATCGDSWLHTWVPA